MASNNPSTIFQGYSTVSGRTYLQAVTGDTTKSGARSSVDVLVTSSAEKVATSMEIQASLTASYGPVASGSTKVDYYHSLEITTYSIVIMVSASKTLSSESIISNLRMLDGVATPTNNAEATQFFKSYGDCFLQSVNTGGEYYGTYVFYCQSREEQESLNTELSASGIYNGVSASASLQTSLDSFTKSTTVSYSFKQVLTGISNPSLPTQDDFVAYALAFPSLTLDAPVINSFDVWSYTKVINQAFDAIERNRLYFTGDEFTVGLTASATKLSDLQDQTDRIIDTYEFYRGSDFDWQEFDPKLASVDVETGDDLDKISAQMEAYLTDPVTPYEKPSLPALDHGTPQLVTYYSYSTMEGGGGGSPFDDVDTINGISNHTHITAIELRAGARVDALKVTYNNGSGQKWQTVHGGGGGSAVGPLELSESVPVTAISGRAGSKIDHLSFTAANGTTLDGGGGGGGVFNFTFPDGMFLVGFTGRSGSELDAFGAVFGGFKQTKWSNS
ncbi:jacalin-like lectin [Thalassospira sp. MCCC 1A01428]|uniref:jacalin-like lectin n=1 Tax=Thalassospira sp. MCCC 1A01428 TaxID=1470575 RepID=UPI000A1E640B|nr:jacalin-like lectin [Thalassospira sp. MCCC 1A01428]OSQ43269.1 hypothetical protein THS27_11285 [Thalassospira sp. MCCC 1A01428]